MNSTSTSEARSGRRWFRWWQLPAVIVLFGLACLVYARLIEPRWIRLRHVQLSDTPSIRIVHISDTHYKGSPVLMQKMVAMVNAVDADIVCFTGDLIEHDNDLAEDALQILAQINKPVYGIRGNHDTWAGESTVAAARWLQQTGGNWLDGGRQSLPVYRVELIGAWRRPPAGEADPSADDFKRVLLIHDPNALKRIRPQSFDLILAGHTHGGQIRLPFVGNPLYDVGEYEYGLYRTRHGPLYVNPGIGTYRLNARFLARPEITVIAL